MLQILGKASSINVRKVLWTCAELGLPFEREDWGSGFKATDVPEFVALNPNAMVPVIKDGEFVLWESNSIIRYLAGRYDGEFLYPSDPCERARCDQWIDWQASELNRAWSYAFLALVRHSPAHQDRQQIDLSCANWARHIAVVDRQLGTTGGFIAGSAFSLADIPIALSINRWLETPLQHADFPALTAYMERLATRPGYLEYCRNGTP
ncbi:glutathione S-transferase family protein [Paraburkholderia nemoris]|jgi:Glutathione S-transferase|uniref:glutathione S-transferase family protein n=1 Tax=Paraburkholderia nemoris TaxID=2793076 RepID=UPI001B1B6A58|nr:glutathione S-transferase family protein [Paraburkholderia nemoris]CAE6727971.1 Glutathione S-transferase GstB [Paraburkholderia nemoris]